MQKLLPGYIGIGLAVLFIGLGCFLGYRGDLQEELARSLRSQLYGSDGKVNASFIDVNVTIDNENQMFPLTFYKLNRDITCGTYTTQKTSRKGCHYGELMYRGKLTSMIALIGEDKVAKITDTTKIYLIKNQLSKAKKKAKVVVKVGNIVLDKVTIKSALQKFGKPTAYKMDKGQYVMMKYASLNGQGVMFNFRNQKLVSWTLGAVGK